MADSSANLGAYIGNNPRKGGWPGAGSPKSAVREACKLAFEKRISTLEQIADGTTNRSKDRIDAIKALGQYGLGERVEVSLSNEEVLATIARVTAKYLSEEHLHEWISDCRKAIKDV